MSRITATFTQLQVQGRKALIPYVTAGFPYADITPELMHAMVAGGADVIELGVPFSDPSADGPVIQKAGDKALAAGVGLVQVLAMVKTFRERNNTTPVVLMGYANPVERYDQKHGAGSFVRDASVAGVDGVLTVDFPPEESHDAFEHLQRHGIDPIFLLAPTTVEARIAQVAKLARGYVYYVSLKGVTGAGNLDLSAIGEKIPQLRKYIQLPIGVGFGIRDGATAARIAAVADAVVIGSRIIEEIESAPVGEAAARVQSFLSGVRAAMDAVTDKRGAIA